jgi:hypothetical protein
MKNKNMWTKIRFKDEEMYSNCYIPAISHVAISQLPLSRQLMVVWLPLYPLSQTREAFDPYVVVEKSKEPLTTFEGISQSK